MSKFSRVLNVLKSLLMIIIGAVILFDTGEPDFNYIVVCCILGLVITFRGFEKLFFYFASARHMVGGKRILINSIINIDLGLLSFLVLLENQTLAILYMISIFILLGAIDVLRSFEIKKNGSKTWIFKLIKGILTIAIGAVCAVFIRSNATFFIVFGCAWIILAVEGLISAFSKSAVTYIPEI